MMGCVLQMRRYSYCRLNKNSAHLSSFSYSLNETAFTSEGIMFDGSIIRPKEF